MSLQHFFLDAQVLSDAEEDTILLDIDAQDRSHARVLRLNGGEHIAVIDASGVYYECEIVSFDGDNLFVTITQKETKERSIPRVTLMQGMPKSDKMGEIVRHATELGVSTFVPYFSKRSIVKLEGDKLRSKTKRWESIAKSAAMQSGQRVLPNVQSPVSLNKTKDLLERASIVLICWEEEGIPIGEALERSGIIEKGLLDKSDPVSIDSLQVMIVIGPEGGLAADEVAFIQSCNKNSYRITLGPSILRTETAGIVACTLVFHELGRM